jgi:hypothetical protein
MGFEQSSPDGRTASRASRSPANGAPDSLTSGGQPCRLTLLYPASRPGARLTSCGLHLDVSNYYVILTLTIWEGWPALVKGSFLRNTPRFTILYRKT